MRLMLVCFFSEGAFILFAFRRFYFFTPVSSSAKVVAESEVVNHFTPFFSHLLTELKQNAD